MHLEFIEKDFNVRLDVVFVCWASPSDPNTRSPESSLLAFNKPPVDPIGAKKIDTSMHEGDV